MKNKPQGKRQRRRNRSPYAKLKKRPYEYSAALRAWTHAVMNGGPVGQRAREHNEYLRSQTWTGAAS